MNGRGGKAAQKRADALTVLGLQEGVSEEEIRKSYKKLALLHHPDKNGASKGRCGCALR